MQELKFFPIIIKMIISLAIGDIDADVKFVDGYFFHQYRNRTVEVFYFYDSVYLLEKSKKISKKGENMYLVYGNHYRYNDTSSFITVAIKRTMDTLRTLKETFKPLIDTISISQYVSERGNPYFIIYLLKQEGCNWQQVVVLMTTLHEIGHHLDPVAPLRTHDDKEREANKIRNELLIKYYYLAKTLLNFKVR